MSTAFLLLDRMWERVERTKDDSDTAYFLELLYLGELVTKLSTAGLVAAIQDDIDRHRYRQLHRLVRADGLGEWSSVLDDVVTGPASQHLRQDALREQRELTQLSGSGSWQHQAVDQITRCLQIIDSSWEATPAKVSGRRYFALFVQLRNKTRGHGAPASSICSRLVPDLETSIRRITDNFSLFQRQWAFLHRSMSGKYRVIPLSNDISLFAPLKSKSGIEVHLSDGVYVYYEQPAKVDLLETNVDAIDFFIPNGDFSDKQYEVISYITGHREYHLSTPFLQPAGTLPASETQGVGRLDIQGECWGNIPPAQQEYVHRTQLEEELSTVLCDDRHPVVTLVGRGGIGKTSLALSVLHRVANAQRFDVILWFSARDIDLLPEGPKLVRPHILNEKDVAQEFARLIEPVEKQDRAFKPVPYLAQSLTHSPLSGPILFVFDNFETVRSAGELFSWINTYIRLPNKMLVTTRFRNFKGDYAIEVSGMLEEESEDLINNQADKLGVAHLINQAYRRDLIRESDGHPYIIKVLLGEVANAGRPLSVPRIMAGKDEILDALFERTFTMLSPAARRVFFTLCAWRSTVPQLALEAVLLRPANEDRIDVEAAVEELQRCSLVDVNTSIEDETLFLSIPLVTAEFGRRKLVVSPMKTTVEADIALLQLFGAAQPSDIRHGLAPRMRRLFTHVAGLASKNNEQLNDYVPILEFVARQYAPAWLLLAQLHEETAGRDSLERAISCVERFLETQPEKDEAYAAWRQLALLRQRTEDRLGEIHAWVELCALNTSSFSDVSNTANRLNQMLRQTLLNLDTDEKRILVQRLVELAAERSREADATDCSRIAWLHMHIRSYEQARRYVHLGLDLDPDNEYCLNLLSRLNGGQY